MTRTLLAALGVAWRAADALAGGIMPMEIPAAEVIPQAPVIVVVEDLKTEVRSQEMGANVPPWSYVVTVASVREVLRGPSELSGRRLEIYASGHDQDRYLHQAYYEEGMSEWTIVERYLPLKAPLDADPARIFLLAPRGEGFTFVMEGAAESVDSRERVAKIAASAAADGSVGTPPVTPEPSPALRTRKGRRSK